jgi:Tfp pilus assembly protein FimT
MNRAAKTGGFTLIELMLAMAFISVLLLAIAMTIIQVGVIYNKGMTLKEVNQSARSIDAELRRSVASSEAFDLTTKFVTNSAGGRLCLGQYSYVWNYAKALLNNDANVTRYEVAALNTASSPVRFLKVPDPAGIYCAKNVATGGFVNTTIRTADANTVTNKTTELLKAGDRTLSLHQFTVSSGPNAKDSATGQQLYTITFTIGTGDITALTSDQSSCLPPGTPNSDFSYCTVQQFSLVVRAGDRVN